MSEAIAVIRASRPNFLILAPLCAGLGIALAWRQGVAPDLFDTLLVLLGAVLAHAAVNLFNEYEDFATGLDQITRRTPFSGGSGALPEVPSAARKVLATGGGTLGLMAAIGLYFLWQRGLPMLVLGMVGVLLILTYTRWLTRSPLLCLLAPGLGFGPVMVLGTLVALGARIDATALLTSLVSLLLASELLLINQIPDAEADRTIGRRHLVITRGYVFASVLVRVLLIASFASVLVGWIADALPAEACLALLTAPAAIWVSHQLPGALNQPERLNKILGTNVAMLLATLVLLMVGLSV